MLAFTAVTSILAGLVAVASASALPSKRATNPPTIENCKVSGQVALTFDDGPYIYEQDVVKNFKGSKGTFFLNGNNWGCIYDFADEIKAAHAAGWTIGNHGWSHAHMGSLSWDQVHDELWKVEQALIKILGLKPIYFRPPYGETSPTLYAALANRGYKKVFLWSDDTEDADGETVAFAKNVYDKIAPTYPAPHLVLNHETYSSTANTIVPYAVSKLTAAGYKLVAVDTCLGSDGEWPYVYVGQPQARDSTWHC